MLQKNHDPEDTQGILSKNTGYKQNTELLINFMNEEAGWKHVRKNVDNGYFWVMNWGRGSSTYFPFLFFVFLH